MFTEAEVGKIVEHFRTTYSGGRWHVWIALLAGTGARPSEIAGLQWADVDLDAGTAEIKRGLVSRDETPGKTHRSLRTIRLAADLVELLRTARPLEASDTDWICVGADGRPIDTASWPSGRWPRQLKRIGIRPRRLYMLRHSYISRALSLGALPLAVADHCGTSLAKISDTYAAWIGDRRDDPLSAARQRSAGRGAAEH